MLIGGGEILVLGMFFFIGIVSLALTAFWIWMLVDALTNKSLKDNDKLIWVLVVVLTHFIGALIYFFVGRRNEEATGTASQSY